MEGKYEYLFKLNECKFKIEIHYNPSDYFENETCSIKYNIYTDNFRKFIKDFDIKYEMYYNTVIEQINLFKEQIKIHENKIKNINKEQEEYLKYIDLPLEFS